MKNLRTKLLVLGSAMFLVGATLAPVIVRATCPDLTVECPNGSSRLCRGSSDGNGHCL
jgi:hypothetical protein